MKQILCLYLALCSIALTFGCSPRENSVGEQPQEVEATDNESSVIIVVTSRSPSWKISDTLHFDVIVKNRTPDVIEVPYLYDSLLEIDGNLYTQFPKPKLTGETNRVIQARTDAPAGAVTLNGSLLTVDANSGRLPLKLTIGEHQLVLICSQYSQRFS